MSFLEVRGLTKRFPGVTALDRVDLDVEEGEVHALVGANGAGKSTLMNIIAGVYRPTAGEIRVAGDAVVFRSPHAATAAGISTVYQEFSSIPELTVAQNTFLAREPTNRAGLIDRSRLRADTQALLDRYHLPLDADAEVGDLSVAQQQLVEIARALSFSSRILILDEPTAVLSLREQENLFEIIGPLKDRGLSILYVSHRLEEIFKISDRVTVLRDGRLVDTARTADIDQADLVRMMIGHDVNESEAQEPVSEDRPVVLDATLPGGSSLRVREGEIVGVAGLVGAGRTRLAKALVGAGGRAGVNVVLDGQPVAIRSPEHAVRHGIVYLTEDRKRDGVFSNLSIFDNTSAAALARFTRWGVVRAKGEHAEAASILERLRLVAQSLKVPVTQLSGGNQQKVVFGRALLCRPRVLICDEPTRGVDIGAKEEIYGLLLELAGQGVAVVFISSETKELLPNTHRLVVMHDGAIVQDTPSRDTDEQAILMAAAGMAA
jgi:ABC-type sugar transport system ATPase subunit